MLKDITLGQYFPGNTIVHRLDPRCKLLLTIVYIAALFTAQSYVSYAVMLIVTGVCIALSRIPLKVILRGLKPLWIIIALTAVLNIFFTPGRELVSFWKITITYEGLVRAVFMVLRITMLIAGTFLLTYTTSPIALTDAMEILFGPLKKLKVPVHEMSMMMSMALRFIPTLIEETDKIMSAQKARGADFETGNLFQRARALLPLLVPPRGRAGRGHGVPLLSRRRGPHAHEAAHLVHARHACHGLERARACRRDRAGEVRPVRRNIALRLQYDGTAYHGWQVQKTDVTVAETLERALTKVCGEPIKVVGCGRTDAGVHAKRYCANFRTNCTIPIDRVPLAVNARLPADIAVVDAVAAPEDFNAIGSCIQKEYVYQIYNSRIRDAFLEHRVCFYPQPLDFARLARAGRAFEGTHDFAAVRSVGTETRTTVRTVHWCRAERDGPLISIAVCADGFLYNMVRAIVGTMVYASYGKIEPEAIPALLATRDRRLTGPTMPPQGLYLNRVWYDGAVGDMMNQA